MSKLVSFRRGITTTPTAIDKGSKVVIGDYLKSYNNINNIKGKINKQNKTKIPKTKNKQKLTNKTNKNNNQQHTHAVSGLKFSTFR